MRILIITKYAWDDTIASGNTLSNLFTGWKDAEIFTICCRDAKPNNNCCNDYFAVSPINILQNVITPWRIGKKMIVSNHKIKKDINAIENTLTLFSKRLKFLAIIYDILYSTRIWLNYKLKKYVDDVNPDVVFSFGVPDAFNYYLIKYIDKRYKTPIVSYYVDNHIKNSSKLSLFQKIKNKRLIELSNISEKCYAISQIMCDDYNKIMHKKFDLLFKGCEMSPLIKKNNQPIKLTYAGNLLYNRDKTLAELSSAISIINRQVGNQVHLDIYTGTSISNDMKERMLKDECTALFPAKPFSEIKTIMQSSDIVLHVESFDNDQIDIVLMSFSTKVIDCLQSGSMVFAIGPSNIASIEFLKLIPGVVVVTDLAEIAKTLKSLLLDPLLISKNASLTNEYARKELTIDKVRTKIKKDFDLIISKTHDRA
jgi:glycosyltransferase involved in cell wall biosynthesis